MNKKIVAKSGRFTLNITATKPGRRTIFVHGKLVSYNFPGLVFIYANSKFDMDTTLIVVGIDEGNQIGMNIPNLKMVCAPHISGGHVCLGNSIKYLIDGVEPADVFFGSDNVEGMYSGYYYCKLNEVTHGFTLERAIRDILLGESVVIEYEPPGIIDL